MEINRKVNLVGTLFAALGIFAIIFSVMILLNTLQFMRGTEDKGVMVFYARNCYQYDIIYNALFMTADDEYFVEVPITKEEFDTFDRDSYDGIQRRVYVDFDGKKHYFEDLDAKPMDVVEEVDLPFKLPLIVLIVGVAMAAGGGLWAMNGKPTNGLEIKNIGKGKKGKKTKDSEGSEEEMDAKSDEDSESKSED